MKRIFLSMVFMAVTALGLCCCDKPDTSLGGGWDNKPGSSDNTGTPNTPNGPSVTPPSTDINLTSSLTVNLSTDKAYYKPGETVNITADVVTPDTKVRYRHLTTVLKEEDFTSKTWTWNPPTTDFQGYMIDLYQKTADGGECIVGTIAVDVSSNVKRFPRYGFVATFGDNKTKSVTDSEMEQLSRHHINVVQFQDWHWKHHWPLPGTPGNVLEHFTDIANRINYTSAIKNYIASSHKYGMLTTFYNLAFGALDDAAEDGVDASWYLRKGSPTGEIDKHDLSDAWKSDIYIVNPGNKGWQNYMNDRIDDVYEALDFDGYQIDQLGWRGDLFTTSGVSVNLPTEYASFVKAVYARNPDKLHIMNSVSDYGLEEIARTGKVDFAYVELWGGQDKYDNLLSSTTRNSNACPGLQTVFATYMNYGLSESEGYFNNPGVILKDAVTFAIGASHLELGGDHMLCHEYFARSNLKMKSSLKTAMIRYYDFMTAYENLLRGDNGQENDPAITTTSSYGIKGWTNTKPLQIGNIVSYSKKYPAAQVVHLINMLNADSNSWRDFNGTMPEPDRLKKIPVSVAYSGTASKVWIATPDKHGGVPQALSFTQKNGKVTFTIPELEYWTMIVIE